MKSGYYALQDYFKTAYFSAIIIQTCIGVTSTALAYSYDDDDCDNPVRLLLLLNTILMAVILTISSFYSNIGFIIWFIWNMTFMILAFCWTFGDSDCESEFSFGFAVSSLMGIVSSFMILLVLVGACVAGMALCIGYGLMSSYEPVE